MPEAADIDDKAFDIWSSKLSRSSLTLAPDVSAQTLAGEFGRLDDETLDDLCSDAVMAALDDDATRLSMAHFKEAYEETTPDDEGERSEKAVQEAPPEPQPETTQETQTDEKPSQPEVYDENNDNVEAAATESQGTDAGDDQDEDTESVSQMSRGELEAEVRDLRETVDELESMVRDSNALVKAVRKQMALQNELLVGAETVQDAGIDPEEVLNHHQRLSDVEERLQEQGDQIQMVRVDGGGSPDDPDSRAQRIRQTLYNKAKQHSEGMAEMDRDDVDSRLGGGLHRDTVLGAMKRAADGYEAEDDERSYTSINGSSDLQPVDSITFSVGEGRGNASKVVMNLSDATGAEIRHNLTTKDTEEAT
ncbi:hypothetical protein [Haloarcula amylolytica]|uniref:Uncharacterized protein n=1 Tax=Haloarcula amylolytica JCM 13557 TaxID=1227452 RepID=M0K8Q5_9EURY|nr:hypothetical protein [Haloarcula amylolytica]EMA17203.1 hypothetical protein C442_18075 [Haloarcula amylolytica JCM 13557]